MRWLQVHTPPARCSPIARAAGATPARCARARHARCGCPARARRLSAGTSDDDARSTRCSTTPRRRAPSRRLSGLNFVDAGGPPARAPAGAPASRNGPSTTTSSGHRRRLVDGHREPGPDYPEPRGSATTRWPCAPRAPARLPAAGMLLDVGHLHITADAPTATPRGRRPVARRRALPRGRQPRRAPARHRRAGIDRCKLDLHLPPGCGRCRGRRRRAARARRAAGARGRALPAPGAAPEPTPNCCARSPGPAPSACGPTPRLVAARRAAGRRPRPDSERGEEARRRRGAMAASRRFTGQLSTNERAGP